MFAYILLKEKGGKKTLTTWCKEFPTPLCMEFFKDYDSVEKKY